MGVSRKLVLGSLAGQNWRGFSIYVRASKAGMIDLECVLHQTLHHIYNDIYIAGYTFLSPNKVGLLLIMGLLISCNIPRGTVAQLKAMIDANNLSNTVSAEHPIGSTRIGLTTSVLKFT